MPALSVASARTARVQLPDGRELEFKLHSSARARSVRLKISARDGVVVTAPRSVAREWIMQWVTSKASWIATHLDRLEGIRHLAQETRLIRPVGFDLPALNESWRIEYRATASRTIQARSSEPGRIVISGAIDDIAACQVVLRRWLMQHGKVALSAWLDQVARECRLRFSRVSVRNQRSRWGSCSARGNISLNCTLLFLTREQVRYVLVHELCHTLERNHSARYWAHVRQLEPDFEALRRSMRSAGKSLPDWMQCNPGAIP